MNKKIFSLVVSAVMLTGLLAGCGGETTPSTDSSNKNTSSDTANKNDSQEKNDSAEGSQVIQVPVTIVNNTDVDIYELYTSGEGIDDWGDSILPSGQVLAPGTQLSQISFNINADNLKWDLLAKDSSGNALEFYGLDLSNCNTSGITIGLSYDRDSQTGIVTAQ